MNDCILHVDAIPNWDALGVDVEINVNSVDLEFLETGAGENPAPLTFVIHELVEVGA